MSRMLFVDSDMEEEDEGSGSDIADTDDDNEVEVAVETGDGDEIMEEDSDGGRVEKSSGDKKKKKHPKNRKAKNKISNEEAAELRDKEHTYSSNLYRVQIQELLNEISVPKKTRKQVQDWFCEFKSFLRSCKASKSVVITDFEKLLKGSPLPLPDEIRGVEESSETIQWRPPLDISIIGSWSSNAAVNKISCVDIALELPLNYYRAKDFLNHRYHLKRAIYLAYLARLLSKRGDAVQFTLQQGNPIKPVILINCSQFKVKVVTSVLNVFKANRLSPDINNLRFYHFFAKPLPDDEPEVATPNYNFSILMDVLVKDSQTSIHDLIESCESYFSALKLIKVWLHQRGLDQGFGGFTGFISSAFISYLSSAGKIDPIMTPYDVIRIFFSSLAQLDLTSNGIGLCSDNSFSNWHLQFDVVFLNSSGKLNYTADMSDFTFKRVQKEAQRAVAVLGQNKLEGFQALFLAPIPFIQNFDHILQLSSCNVHHLIKEEKEQLLLNYSGFQYPVIVSLFGRLVQQCLGVRVQLIDHELVSEPVWNLMDNPKNFSNRVIRFGIIINREAAYKLIEKCDAENSIRAKSFKDLWGEKSQLRRFKDGTMCETVAFVDKHQILYQMLSYIFQAHFDIKKYDIQGLNYIDCQLENAVAKDFAIIKTLDKPKKVTYLKGKRKKPTVSDFQQLIPLELDAVCNKASFVFDDLSKVLRSLEGLPLEVSTVQGTSSILRFTSVHPTPPQHFSFSKWLGVVHEKRVSPMSLKIKKEDSSDGLLTKVPRVVEPITVILHLETSGKWPDDIAAVDRLKCAFLTRIGQLLNDQFGLTVQVHPRWLDVFKDGFIFRIKLTHYRELILLKQHLGPDGVLKVRDSPESMRLEKETVLLPQLTTTLHSFHRQYEAFGVTARLCKRWIASQLLLASPLKYNTNSDQPDCRFTEECVELLVAHMFMSYAPYLSHPNEGQLGFLRFLSLLGNTDWKSTAILLNFHEKLSPKEISAIELDFVRRRNQLPPLFIATPEDKSVWTKHLAPVLLYRAQFLAKEALSVLTSVLLEHPESSTVGDAGNFGKRVKTVFRADTEEFDVLIHLKRLMNPRSCDSMTSNSNPQFHEYVKSSALQTLPVLDFDPVQNYLSELRSSFGHLALFLHDSFGGSFIAVVWKPDAFKEQDFAISNINTKSTHAGCETKLATDVDEVLESFELLGTGLVERLERKSSLNEF